MSARTLAIVWLGAGAIVWNGVFDLYVAEGAREYLQVVAEAHAGFRAERPMADIMMWWQHEGAVAASLWAAFVVGVGWATIWLRGRHRA